MYVCMLYCTYIDLSYNAIHTCTRTYIHTYIHVHTYIHIHTYVYMHTQHIHVISKYITPTKHTCSTNYLISINNTVMNQ